MPPSNADPVFQLHHCMSPSATLAQYSLVKHCQKIIQPCVRKSDLNNQGQCRPTVKCGLYMCPSVSFGIDWQNQKVNMQQSQDVVITLQHITQITRTFCVHGERTDLDGICCTGLFLFFLILGVVGMVIHCLSMGHNGGCADGCRDSCYAWGCFPASMEACGVFLIIFVILFAILGVIYGLLAATMAIQRIWQRHYHILTKRVLTKVCTRNLIC